MSDISTTELLADSIGLLSCPLCGGAAKVWKSHDLEVVSCSKCHVMAADKDGRSAIQRWNTRTPQIDNTRWRWVPLQPTARMRIAGGRHTSATRIYEAMVRAAPGVDEHG